MRIKNTNRGFKIADFKDYYKQDCSLQESSLVYPCIWLGVDVDLNGKESSRMHLDQKLVKQLLPYLQHFAKTGYLPKTIKKK